MKKWTILLLTALLLLQTACNDTPRVSAADLNQRSELEVEENLDLQEEYPAERPQTSSETVLDEKSEDSTTENQLPEEQPEEIPVSEETAAEETTIEIPSATTEEPQSLVETNTPTSETTEEPAEEKTLQNHSASGETRAVWFSYFELETMLKGQSESAFTKNIGTAFDNVAALGLNTVIVQVRPYADAIYPSQYFEWSYLATGTEGIDPGFDPLKILVREAHNRGLSIEAWINPYRIRNANYKQALSSDNVVHSYLASGDAVEYNGGIYFDPASEKAQQLIINGVQEIVANYNVDGIHFDDYFYPTTDEAFDEHSYSAYKKNGGMLTLAEWRRENVNRLVNAVYSVIHTTKNDVRFGISPQGNLENNYNKQFIDVSVWLSQSGYVDYICPQIYFGFNNGTSPYAETVAQWNDLIKNSSIELMVGLAPYKVGTEDTWAGDGKNEWKNNTNLLGRMVECAREEDRYNGFVLFRYDSLFNPASAVKQQITQEIDNLKKVLE